MSKKQLKVTDYQDFTTKDMSIEDRRKLNVGDVWSNEAKCLSCGDVLRSKNKHNFITCSCGNLSVDGGSAYTKRLFRDEVDSWVEMSVLYDNIEVEE
jgi:hypothetical protein